MKSPDRRMRPDLHNVATAFIEAHVNNDFSFNEQAKQDFLMAWMSAKLNSPIERFINESLVHKSKNGKYHIPKEEIIGMYEEPGLNRFCNNEPIEKFDGVQLEHHREKVCKNCIKGLRKALNEIIITHRHPGRALSIVSTIKAEWRFQKLAKLGGLCLRVQQSSHSNAKSVFDHILERQGWIEWLEAGSTKMSKSDRFEQYQFKKLVTDEIRELKNFGPLKRIEIVPIELIKRPHLEIIYHHIFNDITEAIASARQVVQNLFGPLLDINQEIIKRLIDKGIEADSSKLVMTDKYLAKNFQKAEQ